MDAAMHGNHYGAGHHQDPDETTPSDVSERPSVDDVESDTGSTGALETRSLKDHKGNVLMLIVNTIFSRSDIFCAVVWLHVVTCLVIETCIDKMSVIFSINQLVVWSINWWKMLISVFAKVMSLFVLFCPQPKDIQLPVIDKPGNIHIWEADTSGLLAFWHLTQ